MSQLLTPYFNCENTDESIESVIKRLIYEDSDGNLILNVTSGESTVNIGQVEIFTVPVLESLVDDVDIPMGTNYYPDEEGEEMGAYKLLSFTGKLIDSDNTTSIYIQGTNDESPLTADWITLYGYDTTSNTFVNVMSAVSTTKLIGWDFDNFNYNRYRVKLVTGDSSNTVIIKLRKLY